MLTLLCYTVGKASQISCLLGDTYQVEVCRLIPYIDLSSMVSRYVITSEYHIISNTVIHNDIHLGQIGLKFMEKNFTLHALFIMIGMTVFLYLEGL